MTAFIDTMTERRAGGSRPHKAVTVTVASNTSRRTITDVVIAGRDGPDDDLLNVAEDRGRALCRVLDWIDHGPLSDPANAVVFTHEQFEKRLERERADT